jgi:sulfur-oxidizing protein SoxZ
MKIRARADGDLVEVKVLMAHVMETGQRKNQAGVEATYGNRTVLSAQWGPAISANPFLSFKFKGGAKGEKVRITWFDSKGETRTDDVVIG